MGNCKNPTEVDFFSWEFERRYSEQDNLVYHLRCSVLANRIYAALEAGMEPACVCNLRVAQFKLLNFLNSANCHLLYHINAKLWPAIMAT